MRRREECKSPESATIPGTPRCEVRGLAICRAVWSRRALDGDEGFAYTLESCRRDPLDLRKWRNWQTRKPQELVPEREWRFEPSLPHHSSFRSFCELTPSFLPPLGCREARGALRQPPHLWGAAAAATQLLDVRCQAVQYYLCPRVPRLTGSGLTFTFCGKGDRSMRTRLRLYRYSGFGWLRAVCAAAHLRAPHFYRATVEMTADGQV